MTTLARLSFRVLPERSEGFEPAYTQRIRPLLERHGMEETGESGRPAAEGVFSRLFEVETPSVIPASRRALRKDPAWQQVLNDLGTVFGTTGSDGLIRWHLGIYRTPAGPGRTVDAGPGFRRGLWQIIGVHDGLPSATIPDILQDRTGYLWFATGGGGVCRYDGKEFLIFTTEDGLVDNHTQALLEDRAGDLWFGTYGGVSRYDGEEFTTFTVEDGLAGRNVQALLEDRAGDLWFGTEDGGTSWYDGEQFASFTFPTEEGLEGNRVRSILEDRAGNLWFGIREGVIRYDGEQFVSFPWEDERVYVCSMVEDGDGNLWFGSGNGVSRYDGEQFVTLFLEEGVRHETARSLLVDREGFLWMGTLGGGVGRYDGVQVATFTNEDGLAHGIVRLLEDRQGTLWCAAWRGVYRFDGSRFVLLQRTNSVMCLVEDREGRIWFGEGWSRNLYRYDGKGLTVLTAADGLTGHGVKSLLADRRGNLWIGTDDGVIRYDGEAFVTFTAEDGLADDEVWSILEDRAGILWFGTTGGGISRYDGESFVTFTTEDGLASNWVRSLLEDSTGDLWIGTDGGVNRYDGEAFVTFTAEDGLAANHIDGMLEDRDGHIWFAHYGGGVSRYDGLVFQHLSRQHSLANDTVHQVLQDRQGDFWIATNRGLTRYRSRRTPLAVHLEEVIADRRYREVQEVRLPISQNFVIFAFQGQSLITHPEQMVYVYRLEGFEEEWQWTRENRVEYTALPVGEYSFQVRAVDRDLNYSEPASVQVVVEPNLRLEALTEALSQSGSASEFVGESAALRRVQSQLREVAPTELAVLILGETGTGKGLAACTVHGLSRRRDGPFVQINCGAIPEGLVESELFGHEKGAFTGAVQRKLGKVELAEGGTLFLDEIGDMAPGVQVKLLRLLEERTFERVGGVETLNADVRIIAATNRDLRQMVADDQFREDLYYRLQGFPVRLPALRQRREDIPLLGLYFMERMAAHLDKEVTHFIPEALAALQAYAWPGNVRELEHTVQRAVIVCQPPAIRAADILLEAEPSDRSLSAGTLTLEEHERRYILEVLEQTGWVVKGPEGAATRLGLAPSTLYSRMKKLGIVRL